MIRINRDDRSSSTGSRSETHSSETALDEYDRFDQVISNNGSLDQLKESLCTFITGCCLNLSQEPN